MVIFHSYVSLPEGNSRENIYPLVMTNGLPWKPWSIYTVDGLPSDSMVIFHGYVE